MTTIIVEPADWIPARRIDMHCHVGVLGDDPNMANFGHISTWMRAQLSFRIFLHYARIPEHTVSDSALQEAALRVTDETGLDNVVCLALDPVFDKDGKRRPELSHMWVANEYILFLQSRREHSKILFGASVHPYDPDFKDRVREYARRGAVLLKWLPSAQQIDLADKRVAEAIQFLGEPLPDRDGRERVLPLLLHVGGEYAIESTDVRTKGADFLSWSWRDSARNLFRGRAKWGRPDIRKSLANLRAGRDAGAKIILAHCGLPYFATGTFGSLFEHSDADIVEQLIREPVAKSGGRFLADVSALCTPFRRTYFERIGTYPESALVFGSDFPVPIFEIGDYDMRADLAAVFRGELNRVLVPDDNLLDVNERTLKRFFPGHPMFTNFERLIGETSTRQVLV